MIQPSALNVLIIGLSVVLFVFIWRMVAAKLADQHSPFADAMGSLL